MPHFATFCLAAGKWQQRTNERLQWPMLHANTPYAKGSHCVALAN